MKTIFIICFIIILFFTACGKDDGKIKSAVDTSGKSGDSTFVSGNLINPEGMNILNRVNVPKGFRRIKPQENSFAEYLIMLPLKSHASEVNLFDGSTKENNGIYEAVFALDIGSKDLHQCADAIMRLRAEYFWKRKEYDRIHFNFTNGFRADYSEWMKGKRIKVKGNSSYWTDAFNPSCTYTDFWSYLETVFMYAGTLSLSKEMVSINLSDMEAGDVFIQGGSPGHAVIVIDLAVNDSGEKIFLLSQSYMPAQEIHLLKNPVDTGISPWYKTDFGDILETPEWKFKSTHLKRFSD